jgi:hypothetical protein
MGLWVGSERISIVYLFQSGTKLIISDDAPDDQSLPMRGWINTLHPSEERYAIHCALSRP